MSVRKAVTLVGHFQSGVACVARIGQVRTALSRTERRADFEKPRWHGVFQVPIDAHRPASGVGDILKGAEKDKRVASFRPYEEQESRTILFLVDITATGWRILTCGALRLPMEPARTDSKIFVPG